MSLYDCELFNYNSNNISELYVAWRKAVRKIFKLPMRTHNYIVCGIVESVNIILDRRIANYIFNVINFYNTTLTSLINSFHNCGSSVFAENYRYIMYTYNIPSTLWRSDFKTYLKFREKIEQGCQKLHFHNSDCHFIFMFINLH